jgi:thiamine pyrophosphokinase
VLLGETEVVFLVPPLIELPMEAGDVVSLFPLAPVRGRSRGLHWPLDGLDFAPGQMIGTSNRATGPVRIEMDAPGMLAILPRRLMPEVVAQLRQRQAGRWPAP